ncbi:MAG: AI-2E family transporter, partial [Rhodococcus sp. (in: high G+C Gram-positive bacteria)]
DNAVQALADQLQDSGAVIATGVFSGVATAGSLLVTLGLVLVLTFFFVKDGPRFLPWMRGLAGGKAGGHIAEVLSRMWDTLGGFIRTQAIVSAIDAIFIGIGLLILGVPLAPVLMTLTFLGGFIPIVGAFVAGALAVLVALVANGFTTALIVLAIIIVVQQIEGNVLQPVLQSKSMNLHAAVVLLSVTAGASIFGIIGAFLAVPAAAVAAVLMRYLNEQMALRSDEDSDPDPEDIAEKVREDLGAEEPAKSDNS